MVAAGRADLGGPAGRRLAQHISQVGRAARWRQLGRDGLGGTAVDHFHLVRRAAGRAAAQPAEQAA